MEVFFFLSKSVNLGLSKKAPYFLKYTLVLLIVGINFCGCNKNRRFEDTYFRGQLSYQYKILLEIAPQ